MLIVVERCGTFHHYYPIGVYTPLALTLTNMGGASDVIVKAWNIQNRPLRYAERTAFIIEAFICNSHKLKSLENDLLTQIKIDD